MNRVAGAAVVSVGLVVGMAAGCSGGKGERAVGGEERGEQEIRPVQGTFEGVLRGGMMSIGGETTGWVLESGVVEGREGAVGGGTVEVDVSRVRGEAERLEGQRVVVRGFVEDRKYVERGMVRTLVAESIAVPE